MRDAEIQYHLRVAEKNAAGFGSLLNRAAPAAALTCLRLLFSVMAAQMGGLTPCRFACAVHGLPTCLSCRHHLEVVRRFFKPNRASTMTTGILSIDIADAKDLTDFYSEKIVASAKAVEALIHTGANIETLLAVVQTIGFMSETLKTDVGGKLADIQNSLAQ